MIVYLQKIHSRPVSPGIKAPLPDTFIYSEYEGVSRSFRTESITK
jgi:hypothetical protein